MNEKEILEEKFRSAYETVWELTSLLKCNTANVKSTAPLRMLSMEEFMSKLFQKNKKMKEQTVSQGNIHESERCAAYSIAEILWRQLKRIQLPVFS